MEGLLGGKQCTIQRCNFYAGW